jgi:hypothetical protein
MAMDMLPSEAELLDRQRALQMEAEQVARDIMLMELAQPARRSGSRRQGLHAVEGEPLSGA